MFGIFKTWGLPNINLFLDKTIQKSTFDIHLKKLKTFRSSKSKKNSNGFQTGNRSKGFFIIYPFLLAKPLGNQPRFVSNNQTIFTLFVFEHPLGSYRMTVWRINQNPNPVSFKIFQLLMHGIYLIRIRKSVSNISGFKRGDKGRMRKMRDMLSTMPSVAFMQVTDHLLRWMTSLNVSRSLALRGGLPLNLSWFFMDFFFNLVM